MNIIDTSGYGTTGQIHPLRLGSEKTTAAESQLRNTRGDWLTVLLNEEVKIVELLENESNRQTLDDKFNRVDIKARNSKGDIIIVDVPVGYIRRFRPPCGVLMHPLPSGGMQRVRRNRSFSRL